MDYDKIKQLIEDMGNSKLSSLDINFPDGTKISMTREEKTSNITEKESNVIDVPEKIDIKLDKCNIVKSPMVGTFYLKPSPTSAQYVEIGKEIKKGETLCIIEAMKLMNEIQSDFDCEIEAVLVSNEQKVEYGQPLFRVKKL